MFWSLETLGKYIICLKDFRNALLLLLRSTMVQFLAGWLNYGF